MNKNLNIYMNKNLKRQMASECNLVSLMEKQSKNKDRKVEIWYLMNKRKQRLKLEPLSN